LSQHSIVQVEEPQSERPLEVAPFHCRKENKKKERKERKEKKRKEGLRRKRKKERKKKFTTHSFKNVPRDLLPASSSPCLVYSSEFDLPWAPAGHRLL
jgi:hypothetical protein